jgi:hypothetical protein
MSNWDDLTRLSFDPCARAAYDKQSMGPGSYLTTPHGYRECDTQEQYALYMTEPMHYQKVYTNGCVVNKESELRMSQLTNPRLLHPLQTRPYLGSYMGAGQGSLGHKELETQLQCGLVTHSYKACTPKESVDRFETLPEFGNPQRVQHIVEPWTRGGDNTRDYVRRINYEAKLLNRKNNRVLDAMLH